MTFSEYVELNMNKASNSTDVVERDVVNQYTKGIYDYNKEFNKKTWTARIINDVKYLFYNGHFLNITELKKCIDEIYDSNGYTGYGFSKLDESELIRYKTIKNIILKEFLDDNNDDELEPNIIAELIFKEENKDFNWKPEELTL